MTLLLVAVAIYTCYGLYRNLTDFTLARRLSAAAIIAESLQEKLHRVQDVGTVLSGNAQFIALIDGGRWDDAIRIAEGVPRNIPFVSLVSLFDAQGTLKAVTPMTPDLLSAIGKDFSYREYFQGVSKNWEPYVGEVIKPAVPLGYNLAPVAMPIRSDSGKVLGFTLLSVKLDTVAQWSREIDAGPGTFTYVVDQKGQLVSHPTLLPAPDIVDFSSVPSVQRALRGETGVDVVFNPIENEERLSAYIPTSEHGWGVVVVEPSRIAFVERNKAVRNMAIIWVLVIVATALFTYQLLSSRSLMKNQRDREKLLLDSIGDGVVAIDRAFLIISWNKAASLLTGWKKEEALGRPMREVMKFFREGDRKENIVFIEEAMLYGEQRNMESNTLLLRKDGTEIPVADSAAPVFDAKGVVSGAIIVFRDISKERDVQKAQEEFTMRMIHDLRAPATAIKSAAELYGDPEELARDPNALKEGVEIIKLANTRMLGLINSLLESARKNVGIAKAERVVLAHVIQNLLKELTPAASLNGVTLTYVPLADLPPVSVSPDRLQEILVNLIDNAVKYNKKGGTVTISHQIEGGVVKTAVQDTGIGISTEDLTKLFAPYARVNVQEHILGTGLGLYSVKQFVEEAGGIVSVDSKIGEETTFTFSLPVAK